MCDEKPRILLMDDEIATSDVVRYAIEGLRAAGFDVVPTDRMDAAVDGFYGSYYDAFVIDIDMSLVEQGPAKGDGTAVSVFLRAMDADAVVVNFSARGGPHNWFAAANAHLAGYVDKAEDRAVAKLIDILRTSLARPALPLAPTRGAAPRRLLLAHQDPCRLGIESLQALAAEALPGWEVQRCHGLGAAHQIVSADPSQWAVCTVVTDHFAPLPAARRAVSELCALQGRPNVVLACEARATHKSRILHLVNARPFRLLDTLEPLFEERLKEALQLAADHYGRRELLPPDEEGLARLPLELSEGTLDELGVLDLHRGAELGSEEDELYDRGAEVELGGSVAAGSDGPGEEQR